ncbi:MAG: hypothetical protein J2P31_18450, partial [Blastocatellia bacterium]|nr:hypothetical protein [Blastocatellia bacterium]
MPQEQDPYAEFQKQATKPAASSDDPYAEFRKSAEAPPQAATPPAPASSEAPSQTWSEYLQSWVPSTHTVLRSGGALIGGGVGLAGGTVLGTPISGIPGAAAGGAAGASIGESAYQLGQHFARSYPQSQILNRLFPPGDVPLTSGEAASRQAGALAGGALQEGTGAVLSTKFGPALESSALKSASRAIGPSSAQEIRSTREALGTVLRDLPVARNMTSLLDKLQGNLAKEGPELNNLYTSLPPSTNIPGSSQRIIAGLMKLRDRYMEPAVGGTFKPVKGLENVVKGYDDMIREFQGPDLPLQHLRQRRQAWDQLVNWWRKDIARQPASESIYEETANLVRREINQHFPQIAAKNARVAAWKDLVDIANESEPAAWLGGKRVPPSVVGAVGELATGRAPSAFTLGHGAVYASGPLRTIYRTLTAPVKARIADLLA